MTREEAKRFLEFCEANGVVPNHHEEIKAFAEGKKIQKWLEVDGVDGMDGCWSTITNPTFNTVSTYRVKPDTETKGTSINDYNMLSYTWYNSIDEMLADFNENVRRVNCNMSVERPFVWLRKKDDKRELLITGYDGLTNFNFFLDSETFEWNLRDAFYKCTYLNGRPFGKAVSLTDA